MQMHYYCVIDLIEDTPMPQLPLQTESTLTERYQTTVPSVVRKALHLGKKDKIRFTVEPNGTVTLSRAVQSDDDPALNAFLSFLSKDIEQNPDNIQALSPAMQASIQSLVEDVEFDMNAPLNEDDD